MFYKFANQEERRKFGGSAFIEIQFCKLKPNTPIKKIAKSKINYWKDDSLYIHVDDIDKFYSNYEEVFTNGIYDNLKQGDMDIFGTNYYSPLQLVEIIKKINKQKPLDYKILLNWLQQNIEYNGIYILGI